jgi:hypothetical protein
MNEENLTTAVSGLDKCYTNTETTGKNISNNFSNIKQTGLLDAGITKISNQLTGITSSIFNVKNIVKKHSTEMFTMDRQMAKIAEQIDIPQDFVKNDSMKANEFHETLLKKMDGTSVNVGQELGKIEEIADNKVQAQALGDITNSNKTKQEELDGSTIITQQNIANINNENGMKDQNIDLTTSISEAALKNITKGQDLKENSIDVSTAITDKVLKNINKAQDDTVKALDSNTSISKVGLNSLLGNDNKKALDEVSISFADSLDKVPNSEIFNNVKVTNIAKEVAEDVNTIFGDESK